MFWYGANFLTDLLACFPFSCCATNRNMGPSGMIAIPRAEFDFTEMLCNTLEAVPRLGNLLWYVGRNLIRMFFQMARPWLGGKSRHAVHTMT